MLVLLLKLSHMKVNWTHDWYAVYGIQNMSVDC